jgi:hypothetical protein
LRWTSCSTAGGKPIKVGNFDGRFLNFEAGFAPWQASAIVKTAAVAPT